VASLVTFLRAEDLFVVARSARFRAALRRQTFGAARDAMIVVFGVAMFDLVAFAVSHAADLRLLFGLNGALAVTAVLGRIILDVRGPRVAELVAFMLALGVVVATFGMGVVAPDLAILAAGYLILLPPAVTLLLPWRTLIHVVWLLAYAGVAFAFIAVSPEPALSPSERLDVAILVAISILASVAGHILWIRLRIRTFMGLTDLHGLRHEAETQRRTSIRAQAALELAVRQDQLTGTANRLRLHEDLQAERGRIGRTGATCGMLEADIDRFKVINDRLGHITGDTVLREVARLLVHCSRAGDTVYRWGGEEFIILLPGTGAEETQVAGERLRSAIEAAAIVHPGNPPHGVLTVSIGGTIIDSSSLLETDEVWIGRADRALYRAKTAGRNRVSIELPGAVPVQSE
jgi:diguanylate cyclase (GGDEF)-like protein